MDVRPGNILVAVRDPRNLHYLKEVLTETDTTTRDVVVMTARVYPSRAIVQRLIADGYLGSIRTSTNASSSLQW